MKILLTGKDGQVGYALHKRLACLGKVIATDRNTLDLANPEAIKKFIDKIQPEIIINPAAYTGVDEAEAEPQLAYQINAIAPQVFANKAAELNIPIIHFSTDYIFDGLKKEAYLEIDQANPQSVYGQTKWNGEEFVRQYKRHIILRTCWVFGRHGQNFLKTILKDIQEKTSLDVVIDQIGTPTSSIFLADTTYYIIRSIIKNKNFNNFGTYNITSDGYTSWHGYACFILDQAIHLKYKTTLISKNIKGISTYKIPKEAKRPMNSRLDNTKFKNTFMLNIPHWEDEVKKSLKELIQIKS